MLTNEAVAQATKAPLSNVEVSWPLVVAAIERRGYLSKNVLIGAAATIAVETGVSYDIDWDGDKDNCTFLPIKELGGDAYLNKMYDKRTDLGNTPEEDGDGARWAGRGFIQTTGHDNYVKVAQSTGIQCDVDPDLLLLPENAAEAFAYQFQTLGAAAAADAGDWKKCRRRVSGGTNGLEQFLALIPRLETVWED